MGTRREEGHGTYADGTSTEKRHYCPYAASMKGHYRCCAPPLRAATTVAMEHRHHGARVHFNPHHRDEWQLSAPVVLLVPARL
jgi:hypothetical protein